MKKRFENNSSVYSVFLLLLLFLLFSIYYFSHNKYISYYITQATVTDQRQLTLLLDEEMLTQLNKNKVIVVKGKETKIKIQKVIREILKREGRTYHQVVVETSSQKEYPLLDVVSVSIYERKRPLFTIFKTCWKGE